MKNWKRILLIALAVFGVLYAAVGIYLGSYYRADMDAVYAMAEEADIQFGVWGDGTRVFKPIGEWDTALIFYPGGKVECDAYWPLLVRCAEKGVACMLVEMPGNLAVLDMSAAQRVMEMYPEVAHWYLGGHSLGGSWRLPLRQMPHGSRAWFCWRLIPPSLWRCRCSASTVARMA